MYELSIPYQVVEDKEIYVDIDNLIEEVIDDLGGLSDATFFDIDVTFIDNIEFYLEKLGFVYDASKIPQDALDTIYNEFINRLEELYPDIK